MKKVKARMFYADVNDYNSAINVENRLNEFLGTLDYNQIEDIKISSSPANSYRSNLTILVIYTEEE